MLATSRHQISTQGEGPQLLSRIFADRFGRQFRMTFLVAMVDGQMTGRLISAEPLEKHLALKSASCDSSVYGLPFTDSGVICLPITISKKAVETPYVFNITPIVSPFSSIEFLIHSQPTRAPSRS